MLAVLLLTASACRVSVDSRRPAPDGLIVTQVGPGGALERAGLEAGDRLVGWRWTPADTPSPGREGAFTSPFDLLELEHEWAPRAPVDLGVVRAGRTSWITVPPGRWRVSVLPATPAGSPAPPGAEAVANPTELLERANHLDEAGRGVEAIWLRLEAIRDPQVDLGEVLAADALVTAAGATDPVTAGWIFATAATARMDRDDLDGAVTDLQAAAEIWTPLGPDRLALAELAYLRGEIAGRRGDPAEESAHHRRGLERRRRLAPGSLVVARSLLRLAKASSQLNLLDDAERATEEALAMITTRAPHGLDHQAALMMRGILHWFRSEWDRAEGCFFASHRILEEIDPGHPDVPVALSNLGLVASNRGDLAQAETYYRQALARLEAQGAGGLALARTLNNLGTISQDRGDLDAAETYHRRSLDIRRDLAPDSLDVATALFNLAVVATWRDRLDQASARHLRALDIRRRLAPDSPDVAASLVGLAIVDQRAGRIDAAIGRLHEALAQVRATTAGSQEEAWAQAQLGGALLAAGQLPAAADAYNAAIELHRSLATGTRDLASAWHGLGQVRRQQGRRGEAIAALTTAVEALEDQLRRSGVAAGRGFLRADHLPLYRDLLELTVAAGDDARAFELLERSKAQGLLELVRQRALDPLAELDPDLAQRRDRIAATADQILAELGETEAGSAAHRRLLRQRGELAEDRRALWREARQRDPAVALVEPASGIDVAGAQQLLAEGTVALSWSVHEDRATLFVVAWNTGLDRIDLDIAAADLERLVGELATWIQGHLPVGERPPAAAAELFDRILAPARHHLEHATRLVVVPDGPLHRVPFAALADRATPSRTGGRGWSYVVERWPISVVVSLSVLEALRERALDPDPGGRLLAFGDPVGPERPLAVGTTRSDQLGALPFARREVVRLTELFKGPSEVLIGDAATEERALSARGPLEILHFATHAVIDQRSPLDSALILAPSTGADRRRHNGLLEAWEIFESVRLPTRLVTLSGCDTAAGAHLAGEGLLGLSRAFQFAGAQAVVASLWRVSDEHSATLMAEMYERLAMGAPLDRALQQAQLAVLHGTASPPPPVHGRWWGRLLDRPDPRGGQPATDHPASWSGFLIHGDGTVTLGR